MSAIHEHILHEQETGTFNVSLRVLGNELIGFSVAADSFSTKWVVLGTFVTIALGGATTMFGPSLVNLFQ